MRPRKTAAPLRIETRSSWLKVLGCPLVPACCIICNMVLPRTSKNPWQLRRSSIIALYLDPLGCPLALEMSPLAPVRALDSRMAPKMRWGRPDLEPPGMGHQVLSQSERIPSAQPSYSVRWGAPDHGPLRLQVGAVCFIQEQVSSLLQARSSTISTLKLQSAE